MCWYDIFNNAGHISRCSLSWCSQLNSDYLPSLLRNICLPRIYDTSKNVRSLQQVFITSFLSIRTSSRLLRIHFISQLIGAIGMICLLADPYLLECETVINEDKGKA